MVLMKFLAERRSTLVNKNDKEANRLMWMVKGRLIPKTWKDDAVQNMYDSYFVRMWYNDEGYYHEDGFEEVWSKRK